MEDPAGKGVIGAKEEVSLKDLGGTVGTDSSVQEGVIDPGIDNPAFSNDAEGTPESQAPKPLSPSKVSLVSESERKALSDTTPSTGGKSTETREDADDRHAEINKAPEEKRKPATMEVTTIQMDTKTNVVSTHKEGRINVTSSSAGGLDELVAADSIWVTDSKSAVKLRMSENGPGSYTPTTVPALVIGTARKASNHIALATKTNGIWIKWTYLEYLQAIRAAAKSFIKFGLEPGHGVGILGFNAPEWFISILGAIFAGGMGVGIYTTNSPAAVEHVLVDSSCNVAVVEDDAQLQKVLKVRNNLPHLKAIIQYSGSLKERHENVYTWADFLEMGKTVSEDVLEARIKMSAPNKCCTVIYTSGSTGNPKGVMLSHDNITWTCNVIQTHCKFRWTREVSISYLPLSHIAAQLTDIYVMLQCAGSAYFAQPDALKGSLGVTIKEVRPTQFLGVPRVWEKMYEKMQALGKQTTGCKKKIATWAKRVGLEGNLAAMNGQRKPFAFAIANALVFKKIKKAMGFDRCLSFYSGAAPISIDVLHYFMSLDIPILEIYGMSESSGPQHVAIPTDFRLGTVGPTMPGVKTILKDTDADGNGEICFSGRNVFMGYLNSEEKTRDAIDDEGLLHSGDIGKWDETGHYLSITGRIKELLITAGGENVAPVPIEDNVKRELPVISNCMLIGDKRKFLSLLITLKTEVDLDTMIPGDMLTSEAREWVTSVGSSCSTVSQILDTTDVRVMRAIQKGIDKANVHAPSRAQKIQKWTILPVDFSLPGGEMTPTLKLKRGVVLKLYAKTIEAFYKGT